MQNDSRILKTLGLSQRAGKCVTGDELYNGIGNGKVKLVFLANDASERTKKQLTTRCEYYDVELIEAFDKEELSFAVGKNNRVAVGIVDDGFSELMRTYFNR